MIVSSIYSIAAERLPVSFSWDLSCHGLSFIKIGNCDLMIVYPTRRLSNRQPCYQSRRGAGLKIPGGVNGALRLRAALSSAIAVLVIALE
jgi:hypothetical protein